MRYMVGVIFCALMVSGAAVAQEAARIMTVQGTGNVAVKPDILRISVGVSATADTAVLATRAMSDDMTAVMQALTQAGLPSADVQTNGLYLRQKNGGNGINFGSKAIGFTSQSNVTIVLRDLDRAGEILDTLVSAGANQINQFSFDVADPAPFYATARRAAVGDAMDRAALYADAAGVTLGNIVQISENGVSGSQSPILAEMARSSAQIPMSPGLQTISANVTLIIAIE